MDKRVGSHRVCGDSGKIPLSPGLIESLSSSLCVSVSGGVMQSKSVMRPGGNTVKRSQCKVKLRLSGVRSVSERLCVSACGNAPSMQS